MYFHRHHCSAEAHASWASAHMHRTSKKGSRYVISVDALLTAPRASRSYSFIVSKSRLHLRTSVLWYRMCVIIIRICTWHSGGNELHLAFYIYYCGLFLNLRARSLRRVFMKASSHHVRFSLDFRLLLSSTLEMPARTWGRVTGGEVH